MTALKQFERLESSGLWRETPQAQRREVIVKLGEATLVICDMADRPLTHWSLPAISRLNPGESPALFTPDTHSTETLELADDLLAKALEDVQKALRKRKAHPGRLRQLISVSVGVCFLFAVFFWLPEALLTQAGKVVPSVKRAEIGATLLGHIQRVSGQTCRNPRGTRALEQLRQRTLGPDAGGQAYVVPGGADLAVLLPGGLIVLNRDLIEDTEDPAVVAGHILAAAAQANAEDPLIALLRASGIRSTIGLLTTGEIAPETLRAYAETIFTAPPARTDHAELLPSFERAQISSTPYAYALDVSGEQTLTLIEADPMAGKSAPEVLPDSDWISLQGICSQ